MDTCFVPIVGEAGNRSSLGVVHMCADESSRSMSNYADRINIVVLVRNPYLPRVIGHTIRPTNEGISFLRCSGQHGVRVLHIVAHSHDRTYIQPFVIRTLVGIADLKLRNSRNDIDRALVQTAVVQFAFIELQLAIV